MLLLFNVLRERHTGTHGNVRERDKEEGNKGDAERSQKDWGAEVSPNTHSTSRERRALNAPSSIQLMWFLSSWLVTKSAQKHNGVRRGLCGVVWLQQSVNDQQLHYGSCVSVFLCVCTFTHRFFSSVAPLNALRGIAWMPFSLRSLKNQTTESGKGGPNTTRQTVCVNTQQTFLKLWYRMF